MRGSPRSAISAWLIGSILIILCIIAAAYLPTLQQNPPSMVLATLPGQQIWKEGVSSFLFGTNDTYEWSSQNTQTNPAIQNALRSAGFTLIRSFFPDNASDAAIEQRMRTIENIGARCLGVITNIFNVTFDEHLVRYLGSRCQMYEFGKACPSSSPNANSGWRVGSDDVSGWGNEFCACWLTKVAEGDRCALRRIAWYSARISSRGMVLRVTNSSQTMDFG